jgi:hypothetical protein
LNEIIDWIKDRVWPSLAGSPGKTQNVPSRVFSTDADAFAVAAILTQIETEEGAEEERRKAIDQKLLAVLQFAAIAVTVSLGVATFFADPRRNVGSVPLTVIVCAAAYVSLQCFHAALKAIDGLGRRGFSRPALRDVCWHDDSDLRAYQHRIAHQRLSCLALNAEVINEKVGCMAVSHEALRNALAVLMVGAVVLALLALMRTWAPHWLPHSLTLSDGEFQMWWGSVT